MPALPARYSAIGSPISGGMGAVQIAQDEVLERRVAIKFLHTKTHRRRIQDELGALLKMRSKHVVQVYDILRYPGDEIGIVQEFIDGPDLSSPFVAPSGHAGYHKRLWQIAAGIADIHELGVIHRDIKPNNMKTDPEGVIKIFDFGLARDVGPSAVTTGFKGTQGFAAPELFSAHAAFTPAVDTYAFGVVALYLAAGTLPAELIHMPPLPAPASCFAGLPIGLSPDVSAALEACLSASPADRPPMEYIRDLLARHVLHGRHEAVVVYNGKPSRLNASTPVVDLSFSTVGQIRIAYNGLDFVVDSISGEVMINNRDVAVGDAIPGSCVVALGGAHRRGDQRRFITFDVSHPEIVL